MARTKSTKSAKRAPGQRGALPGSTHQKGRRASPLYNLIRTALIRIMAKDTPTAEIAERFGVDRSYIIRLAASPFTTEAVTTEEENISSFADLYQSALTRQGFGFLFRAEHMDPGPIELLGARERRPAAKPKAAKAAKPKAAKAAKPKAAKAAKPKAVKAAKPKAAKAAKPKAAKAAKPAVVEVSLPESPAPDTPLDTTGLGL